MQIFKEEQGAHFQVAMRAPCKSNLGYLATDPVGCWYPFLPGLHSFKESFPKGRVPISKWL